MYVDILKSHICETGDAWFQYSAHKMTDQFFNRPFEYEFECKSQISSIYQGTKDSQKHK